MHMMLSIPPPPAAYVMYEQALRLGREAVGVGYLQKQANCYCVALTALRITEPRYAWVVRPVDLEEVSNGCLSLYRLLSFYCFISFFLLLLRLLLLVISCQTGKDRTLLRKVQHTQLTSNPLLHYTTIDM